jgi:hypothetical protein
MTYKIINHVTSAAWAQLLCCGCDPVEPRPYSLDTLAISPSSVLLKIKRKLCLTGGKVRSQMKLRDHELETGGGYLQL